MMTDSLPLAGVRVLVPRGGDLGDRLAAAVSRRGGQAVIAPAIRFDDAADAEALSDALSRLAGGSYDWVAVTSATAVEVLARHAVRIPETTRVAVVGAATRDAMQAAGYPVHFMPSGAYSAAAMVAEWPGTTGSVLLPQSAIAEATLADGLAARGLTVTAVPAYRTTALTWSDDIRSQFGAGRFGAVLLTSASVARAVAEQGVPVPRTTVVACIGASTEAGAAEAGLPVHAVAAQSTAEGLVDALAEHLSTPDRSPLES